MIIRRPGNCAPSLDGSRKLDYLRCEEISDYQEIFCLLLSKCSSHAIQVPEGIVRDRENEEPPAVGDQFRDPPRKQKVHKSMEPHEIYPQVLRELVEKVAKVLLIIFEKLWQ